jgi:hypothetical protein
MDPGRYVAAHPEKSNGKVIKILNKSMHALLRIEPALLS